MRERSTVLPIEGDTGGIDGFVASNDGWIVVHGREYTRIRAEGLELHDIPPVDQALGALRVSGETEGLIFIAPLDASAVERPPLAVPVY